MLEGIIRESIDKKATKALRRDGYLIANIYGKGVENLNVAFKSNEFIKAVRSKETLVFKVKVDGKELDVVIQEYQTEPVNGDLVHVDLRVATAGVISSYLVPVYTTGVAKGLKNKGVLITAKRRLKVKCDAKDLPNSFTLDVTNLDVGDYILVRNIELPSSVTMMEKADVAVVGVIKAK
jgi:large subunit ribosomal protein L25